MWSALMIFSVLSPELNSGRMLAGDRNDYTALACNGRTSTPGVRQRRLRAGVGWRYVVPHGRGRNIRIGYRQHTS
jgi:PPE-repeat protein